MRGAKMLSALGAAALMATYCGAAEASEVAPANAPDGGAVHDGGLHPRLSASLGTGYVEDGVPYHHWFLTGAYRAFLGLELSPKFVVGAAYRGVHTEGSSDGFSIALATNLVTGVLELHPSNIRPTPRLRIDPYVSAEVGYGRRRVDDDRNVERTYVEDGKGLASIVGAGCAFQWPSVGFGPQVSYAWLSELEGFSLVVDARLDYRF